MKGNFPAAVIWQRQTNRKKSPKKNLETHSAIIKSFLEKKKIGTNFIGKLFLHPPGFETRQIKNQ